MSTGHEKAPHEKDEQKKEEENEGGGLGMDRRQREGVRILRISMGALWRSSS